MGYATITRVQRVENYRQAVELYERVKPMRGRAEDIRPMGDRRDADTYYIRPKGEDMECVLYKTPVITFKPDGDVVVFTNGYATVSTNQFIHQVLGIPSQHVRGVCVLTVGDKKYPIGGTNRITLRADVATQWKVMDAQVMKGHVLNRAKANSVRAKYKPFFDYLKAMLKVRKETITNKWTSVSYEGVRLNIPEFTEHFVTFGRTNDAFDFSDYLHLNRKGMNNYEENIERFMELVQSADTSDLHKAFLCVAVATQNVWGALSIDSDGLKVRTDAIKKIADDIILMLHAAEVLDEVELPLGKLPNRKYMGWMC